MTPQPIMRRHPAVAIFGLTLIYVVVAKLSLMLSTVNPSVTAIWPPTGIALAAFLLYGSEVWPAVFIGAFVTNVLTTGTIFSSLWIAGGNLAEVWLAFYLTTKYASGTQMLRSPRTIFLFTLFAGLVAPLISTSIGITTLRRAGLLSPALSFPAALTWWLGDMGGALIITPFILAWVENHNLSSFFHHKANFSMLVFLLFAICVLVFAPIVPFVYLTIPVLLWTAFTFSSREVITEVFIITIAAVWATMYGHGPFVAASADRTTQFFYLQIFVCVLSVTKLIVSSVIENERDQKALVEASEHRYRTILEKSTDAISLIDKDARILYASPSTKQVLGYSPEEFVGMAGLSLVHPEDLDAVIKILSRVVASPSTPIRTEFRYKRKDGHWIWIETVGRNLLHDPAIGAIVINYRDITERKNLEQAKDEFMVIAAHQLRSPLSVIRWNVELSLGDAALIKTKVRNHLQAIAESTYKMIHLVEELLEATRIISGTIQYHTEPIDVRSVIDTELRALKPLAAERKIKLTAYYTRHPIPTLMLDQMRFTSIIQNLLTNALRYSNPGGTVRIRTDIVNQHIVISVADHGIGVPEQEQSKLFTKFFRASNATRQDPNGSGLGLYAVQNYVDHWRGTIRVESSTKPDTHGTTVTISLPLNVKNTVT